MSKLIVGDVETNSINGGPFAGFRNAIINGAMQIDQRNEKASHALFNGFKGYDLFDRYFRTNLESSVTVAGSTDAPAGFSDSMLLTFSNTGGHFSFGQKIEGFTASALGLGTADASYFTVSFSAKCSTSGTYSIGFSQDFLGADSYVTTFSIVNANTWEKVIVTVPPAVAGTWNKTNGAGLTVIITLVAAGFLTTTTLNVWKTGVEYCFADQTTIAPNGTFQITGLQLEAGSVATPFERRPVGTELALCQRYFALTVANGRFTSTAVGQRVAYPIYFPQPLRAVPSISTVSAGTVIGATDISLFASSETGGRLQFDSSVSSGSSFVVDRVLSVDSEL